VAGVAAGAVEKMDPTSGVQVSAGGEREDAEDGRREIKKKTYFCKYANDARGPSGYEASGPGWWVGGLGGLGRPAGQGRVGVVAGSAEGLRPSGERESGRFEKRSGPRLGSRAESEEEGFLN
jgi:hypothetical protein